VTKATIEIPRHEYESLQAEVVTLRREVEKLHHHIHNANHRLYGAKTERLSSEQIRLSFEAAREPEQQPLEREVIVPRHTRTVRTKKPLPGDLPRETIVYEPETTTCPCCSAELVTIGEDRSEELESIPAQLKVIEHVRIRKACPSCRGAGVIAPPLPPSVFPLERVRAGAGLLAQIVVAKYVDHLPLHRQEQIFKRQGIEIARQRMCDWVGGVTELLMPLYTALRDLILAERYVQADETTIKIQDGEEEKKCHTGYLWGITAPPGVWFHYAATRAQEVPKEIFAGYTGTLQTDLYQGYNVVMLPGTVQRIACLAHVRRKFLEAQKSAPKECGKVLSMIAELYRVERSASSPEARAAIRESKSRRLLTELLDYLVLLQEQTLPRSPLAGAIAYALKQRAEIERIMTSGKFELDNNAIERQMRPIAIGRKNWIFAGSHDGARRAAVLYSLLNTCRTHKVNPWEWLADVLRRVGAERGVKPDQLLPQNWKKVA
jgi:transposase